MSRTLKRSVARAHYGKFAKLWREDLRISGQYGQPNSPKRPPFNQWYAMHQKNLEMTKESTPADVQEYMSAQDPWAQETNTGDSRGDERSERGVTHIDIATGKEDEE